MPPVYALFCGMVAGVIIPSGYAPLYFWPLSLTGIGLLFACLQSKHPWSNALASLGFAITYTLTGQLWNFYSHYLFRTDPGNTILNGVLTLFILPAVILFLIFSLHRHLRSFFLIRPYTFSSALLFSSQWLLFELLYLHFPHPLPLLLVGYAFIGLITDRLLPVFSVLGNAYFIALITALGTSLGVRFWLGKKASRMVLIGSLLGLITLLSLLSQITFTRPYDDRTFRYSMMFQATPTQLEPWLNIWKNQPPTLLIISSARKHVITRPLYDMLVHSPIASNTAFLGPFRSDNESEQLTFCSFGDGEGCTKERDEHSPMTKLLLSFSHTHPQNRLSGNQRYNIVANWHPSINGYRTTILSGYEDSLSLTTAMLSSGSEFLTVFDNLVTDHVLRERLISADRARALETGRPVLRYSQTDQSVQISHTGVIKARYLPDQVTVSGTITPMTGQTFFMKLGLRIPACLLILSLLILSYIKVIRKL